MALTKLTSVDKSVAKKLLSGLPIQVSTVAEMKTESYEVGQVVETVGYYTEGDAGAARYLVKAAQAFDGYGDHVLANGTVAVLQSGGVINLTQFGAISGGTSEDTALFQAAVNALSDGDSLDLNGTNSVLKNTFITANNVTILNGKITAHTDLLGVMLYITGDNVALKNLRSYVDGAASAVSKGTITFFECTNGTVSGCRLEGGRRTGTNNNVANMVCAAKSTGIIITDNVFYEAHYVEMVQLESSTHCIVSDNVMSSTGLAYSAVATTDFYVIGGDSKHVVSNNTCTNYLTSILTINTAGVAITGNVLDISVQEQGVNMGHTGSGAPDCTVTGNTISGCAGAGVALAEATNTVVSNNVIRYCGEAGIDTSSTISAIISDNFIHNIGNASTGNGLKLSTSVAASYLITNNRFKTIKGNGIEINGSVVDCIVTNNVFSDINTGGFGGGRFPVNGTLDAVILPKTIIFDNNIVNGTFTTNRVVSLGNTHSDMVLSVSNNVLTAITSTSQLFFSVSGTQPLSRSVSRNKMGAAPMVGVATISGGTNSVIVSNINQTPYQRPICTEVDNDAAQVEIYVSSFGAGTFTISSRLTPAFDALIQYDIN